MEVLDIEKLLKDNGISEKVIFYGIEDIDTRNPVWKVFALIKKLTPNFVQFNKLPASQAAGGCHPGGDVIYDQLDFVTRRPGDHPASARRSSPTAWSGSARR